MIESVQLWIALIAFLIVRHIQCKIYRKYYKLPDGPEGAPFVGCLPFILINMISNNNLFTSYSLDSMAMTYGEVICYFTIIGYPPTIILNSSKLIKKVVGKLKYRVNPKQNNYSQLWSSSMTPTLISPFPAINPDTESYKNRRKLNQILINNITNDNFFNTLSIHVIEKALIPEVENCIKNNSNVWYPKDIIHYIIFITMYKGIFGTNEDDSNDKQLFKQMIEQQMNATSIKMVVLKILLNKFPKIFRNISWFKNEYLKFINKRYRSVSTVVNRHLASFHTSNNINESQKYIYLLFNKMQNKDEIIADISMTLTSGSENIANAIDIGIYYIAKFKDIQGRVRNELLKYSTNSSNHKFNISKIKQFPLLRALVYETLRVSNVAPIGAQYFVNTDIHLSINNQAYKLPKNSYLTYNTKFCHSNNKFENWSVSSTHALCLENWLKYDDKNDTYKFFHCNSHVSFGYGVRDCTGKILVVKQMLFIFGWLISNYEFKLQNDEQQIKTCSTHTTKLSTQIPIVINPVIGY